MEPIFPFPAPALVLPLLPPLSILAALAHQHHHADDEPAHAEADEEGRDHVIDGVRDHVVALSPTPGRRARRDSGTPGPALPADASAACAPRGGGTAGRGRACRPPRATPAGAGGSG